MRHIVSMGEALIDFIPKEKGCGLQSVSSFIKMPGGAPANVAACAAKLGRKAYYMGMVGNDGFGSFLISTLESCGVDISYIKKSNIGKTGLAFVSLTEGGERDFIFYRDPSADQLFEPKDVDVDLLNQSILHFCSVSLKDFPIKDAHIYAISEAKKRKALISFDPNVRLALWEDHEQYQKVIRSFLSYADILKISDDEISFVTGCETEEEGILFLRNLKIRYLAITRGKNGVSLYTKKGIYDVPGFKIDVKDTTGAGDAWIGAFLSKIALDEVHEGNETELMPAYLIYANAAAALTTSKLGAISALPTQKEIDDFIMKSSKV
jgi:fructokinase